MLSTRSPRRRSSQTVRLAIVAIAATVSIAACGSSTATSGLSLGPTSAPTAAAPAGSPSTGSSSVASAGPTATAGTGATTTASPGSSPGATTAPFATGAPSVTGSATACSAPLPSPGPSNARPAAPSGPAPAIALKVVATGLSAPLGIVSSADGTGRLFIVEQTGQILVLKNGAVLATPFLDISSQISEGGEQGLLGLAFHPQYACSGRFFVDYTDRDGNTVVAEYHVSATDPDRADPQPTAHILHVAQPFPNHNGGEVLFGPDGMLYIGLGDGGSEGDPMGNGQRTDTLLGKLLRIDVDHPSGGRAYGIPAGNPFADGTKGRPEIEAYGLRNPWRFSFDRLTGDLWIGDVGQDRWEEVDEVIGGNAAGLNFGWKVMEADHCYPGDTCDQTGLTLPVAEYDHNTGDCAVIGGYVYRGSAIPGMGGRYLFGDECSGRIRVLTPGPDAANTSILLSTNLQLTSFGQDDQGELYVAAGTAGEILEIVATN